MIREIATTVRLGVKTLKNQDFKDAFKKAMVELHKINMQERKDLKDLKQAYNEQKRAYLQSYDLERKHALICLFTRVGAAYKQEKLKDMLAREEVETVFD